MFKPIPLLILLLIALVIGFACGYGVRELKSRRRRAAARKEYLRKQEQKRYDDSTVARISDTDGAPIVPERRTSGPIPKTDPIERYGTDIGC
jgi:hypothetical protein